MADKIEIYRNYGVLAREKIHTYTYGGPAGSAVCSDRITVSVPEGWTVGENTMGETLLTSPWGQNYLVNEVLKGAKYPCFAATDKDGRNYICRLKEEKEAGGNEKPHMAAPVHEREER